MLPEPIKDANSSFVLPDQTCQRLTLAQITLATNNFHESLVIGRGGFGNVYKSLNNFGSSVKKVALKRLHSESNQGTNEFEVEVKLLSTLRHGNLVPLIGYCSEGKEMILAYEFMPNGTLEEHLHRGETELSWLQRLKICIGAARGLDYLHTGTSTQHGVIHRDVKSPNILLDSNFAARISDFGLAKVGTVNHTQTCHVSTLVKGTFGYMDPCYFYSGKLTRKSDVYAFGVVLFEVLTGKKAVDSTLDEDQLSLAVWAQDLFRRGRLDDIISCRLLGQISKKCLKGFTSMAVQCLHFQPKQRPTMAEVVVKLESILLRERERNSSGVDDGRFINKVRYFFTSKAELMPAHAEENKAKIIQKSVNRKIRAYTYEELVSATNNYNDEVFSRNTLGPVYKGWVDELTYDPTEPGVGLAMYVKTRHISELDLKSEEFDHPNNLPKLLGYHLNSQELSCVYELSSSLDKLLFVEPGTCSLSWVARMNVAQGLSFLHKKGRPGYTQLKTTCIMVDADYNARLQLQEDYNARLQDFEVDDSFVDLSSYSFETDAPEWFHYQADVIFDSFEHCLKDRGLGVTSEIYSFGVVLLEILTGMKVFDRNIPKEKQNLVKWATPLLAPEVNLEMILDPQLQDNNQPPKGAIMFAELVSDCLQTTEGERPLMEKILMVLRACYSVSIVFK